MKYPIINKLLKVGEVHGVYLTININKLIDIIKKIYERTNKK